MREDPIHEGTCILPQILYVYTFSKLYNFWVEELIETSEKCIYNIIGISESVYMQVFGWSFKIHLGLPGDVKV